MDYKIHVLLQTENIRAFLSSQTPNKRTEGVYTRFVVPCSKAWKVMKEVYFPGHKWGLSSLSSLEASLNRVTLHCAISWGGGTF